MIEKNDFKDEINLKNPGFWIDLLFWMFQVVMVFEIVSVAHWVNISTKYLLRGESGKVLEYLW